MAGPALGRGHTLLFRRPALPRQRQDSFYTHTADQYAQFGSRAISSTTRAATYVLDKVLGNETEMPLLEHTTDTADVLVNGLRPLRSLP
ncbi:Tn3 family transposase [Hymenobacter montanus]|uniref:Tn3 family transposase n=1 Tax=Hymenobacter montanus TaxID=2771359 RepID=UPI00293BEAAE|nr:Tn3 family transposase [Hymenobacter montanus]